MYWLAQKWNFGKTFVQPEFFSFIWCLLWHFAMKCFSWCPYHPYREVLQTIAEEPAQCRVAIRQKFSSMSRHKFLGPDLCIHAAPYFNTNKCGTCGTCLNDWPKRIFFQEENAWQRKIRVRSVSLIRKQRWKMTPQYLPRDCINWEPA